LILLAFYGTTQVVPFQNSDLLLIWAKRIASPQSCHPERSAAESKDLRLLFVADVAM
jgi:hypothetical protein